MLHKIYTVFDVASGFYAKPFLVRSKGEAIRAIMDILADEKHELTKYSADYTLFELGTFDDNTGMYNTHVPKSLGCLLEFKSQVSDETV
jgi:hypothetical protein